jgi:hypothetical protein
MLAIMGSSSRRSIARTTASWRAAPFRPSMARRSGVKRVRLRAATRVDRDNGAPAEAFMWLQVHRGTLLEPRVHARVAVGGWRTPTLELDVASDATQIRYRLAFVGQGRASLDDATLEVIDPGTRTRSRSRRLMRATASPALRPSGRAWATRRSSRPRLVASDRRALWCAHLDGQSLDRWRLDRSPLTRELRVGAGDLGLQLLQSR